MTAPSPAAAGLPAEDVERVARAIFDASNPIVESFPDYWQRVGGGEETRDHYRRLAAAALAEMRPTAAEEAVKRAEALETASAAWRAGYDAAVRDRTPEVPDHG